jgi:hypothetical protein
VSPGLGTVIALKVSKRVIFYYKTRRRIPLCNFLYPIKCFLNIMNAVPFAVSLPGNNATEGINPDLIEGWSAGVLFS